LGLEHRTALGLAQKALFDGIRRGDEGVASEAAAQLLPVVHATLDRLLGTDSPAHAECVRRSLEQTIIEISRHPQPWLCGLEVWSGALTARVALTVLRRGSNARAAHAATSERKLARRSGIERLRSLLAELPPAQAEAIMMRDVLGLAPSQVAVTLRISMAALADRLAIGHERLAARMAEERMAEEGAVKVARASTRAVAAAQ
jgi:DNA-directed RNA polymerase specialized sigma24 family protein